MRYFLLLNSSFLIAFSAAESSDVPHQSTNECALRDEGGCREIDNNISKNKIDTQETSTNANTCSVYLAPSSVPGGGFGMYTAKFVEKGGVILPSDGPSIPIIEYGESERSRIAWVDLFGAYWWESGTYGPTLWEADYAVDYQITMGALPNSHPVLDNLDGGSEHFVPYDDSLVDRAVDPGAGAFSYYTGRQTLAYKRDVQAGEELFLEYPEGYMNYISEKYDIPKKADYEEAGEKLSDFLHLFEGEEIASNAKNGTPLVWTASDHVKSLLPKTQSDLDSILLSADGSYAKDDLTVAIAKEMSVKKRSVDWLEENGLCLDNILPGKSTNPQAGKGAIAQRSMKKGEIVTPASLLQITDRDALRIPEFEGEYIQLLINYCFGRNDSSLLLCPNTNAVLLNHCSDRRPDLHPCSGGTEPNAKYEWAKWDTSTDEWLEKSIEDMIKEDGRGLSLNIIATRDIKEGEEVFIDYGEQWEDAWDRHLDKWEPITTQTKEEWRSVKELNDKLEPLPIASAISEQYLSMDSRKALFTACLSNNNWDGLNSPLQEDVNDYSVEELIEEFGVPAMDSHNIQSHQYANAWFRPCIVLKRQSNKSDVENDRYAVHILQFDPFDGMGWENRNFLRIITDFPRASIRHFYMPFESDLHLPNAFRHHIELNDDIFPEHWKDRAQ